MTHPHASLRSPAPRARRAADWDPGPAEPELPADEIHVWLARLDPAPDSTGEAPLAWLSADERERAARILGTPARARWARSRALLRALLGRYLDADPASLTLVNDDLGKPYLAGVGPAPAPNPPLCFSLSHSGHLALFALARGPLGVDLELGRRWVDEPAVAARALSHEHADRLARLPATRRREEFLRLWARHEAAVKLGGTGIWSTPASEAPWVIDLDPGEGAAALAAAAAPRSVRCWTLPG